MASRGATVADYALLPESQWLESAAGLADDGFSFSYPAYQFMLDFPITRWDDTQTTDMQRAAVQSFADFLLGEKGQALAIQHGLRPVSGGLDETATRFVNAQANGIQLSPDFGVLVQPDSRNTIDSVIRLAE
jgi:ABC-type sulfate transport system substrate-binding protein